MMDGLKNRLRKWSIFLMTPFVVAWFYVECISNEVSYNLFRAPDNTVNVPIKVNYSFAKEKSQFSKIMQVIEPIPECVGGYMRLSACRRWYWFCYSLSPPPSSLCKYWANITPRDAMRIKGTQTDLRPGKTRR